MKKPDHLVRYRAPERINHWIVAICFVMAALSGLGFFFPSFNWLMQIFGTPQLARILHPFVGVVMFVAFMLMFLRYWKHNLINRDDLYWARNIHRIALNEEVGDTGKYNFGQKCVFWAAIISLVLLLASGIVIATLLCRCLRHSADSSGVGGTFGVSGGADHRHYGAHLCCVVGQRHTDRDGGRLGQRRMGQAAPSSLVSRAA